MCERNLLQCKTKHSNDPEKIAETIENLRKVLQICKKGIGLAANQIDIDESVCIVHLTKEMIFVNPEIISHSSEMFEFHEGCLSYADTFVNTERYRKIVVKSDNRGIETFEYDADGFDENNVQLACIQHEIDHLNGITIFERKKRH